MREELSNTSELRVNDSIVALLMESARWARFLSVIGFIMVFLFIVSAIILPGMLATSSYSDVDGTLTQEYTATGVRVNFFILAALLFVPCIYLFRFAVKMKAALIGLRQDDFETSIRSLKSTLKFYGILTIVVMALYALAFVLWLVVVALQP